MSIVLVDIKSPIQDHKKLNRLKRLIFTPLGSRVMLPDFGSNLHELIDKPINFEWKLLMKKYLFECFFDKSGKLWDRDFEPEKIVVSDLDIEKGLVEISITFSNNEEISFGYTI